MQPESFKTFLPYFLKLGFSFNYLVILQKLGTVPLLINIFLVNYAQAQAYGAERVMLKYEAAGSFSPWVEGSDRNANRLSLRAELAAGGEASLSTGPGDRLGTRGEACCLAADLTG